MGAYRLSSGRVVPSAFLAYGGTLTEEMKAELERRDLVVHQGLVVPEGADTDRDVRGMRMIRTLLIALIAKSVDYAGAINGWDLGRLGRSIEPHSWWTIRDEDRRAALQTFVAESSLS